VIDDLRATAGRWRLAGRPAIVVQVVATRGSVPREAGTRMLVTAGEVVGTIGGGHLELQAIEQAREMLVSGGLAFDRHVALGPSLGQCCGGALDLRFTPLTQVDPALWESPAPRFFLQLHGAGHVGRAVARLLAEIPCHVQWIDVRESEFPESSAHPQIERVVSEDPPGEVATAPAGAFYLVLTHSHDLDLALSLAILRRGDAGYFGLIGSRTKRMRFEHRLTERGVDPAGLARMVCPIGVPGIVGKEPEVIAIGVLAQMLQRAGE
jgi:xanthine dehydrogenase accessory factor